MASEEQIRAQMQKIIWGGDLDELTIKSVVKQLSAHFGEDFKPRKPWVKTVTQEIVDDGEPEPRPKARAKPSAHASTSAVPAAAAKEEVEEEEDDAAMARRLQEEFNDSARRGGGRRACAKPAAPKRRRASKSKSPGGDGEQPRKKTGFAKPQHINEPLATFLHDIGAMGADEYMMGRTDVVKAISNYVKEKELQNPKDRRVIVFDEALQSVFKRKTATYFSLQKFLSPFIKTPEADAAPPAPAAAAELSDDSDLLSDDTSSEDEEASKKRSKPKAKKRR